MKIVIDYHPFVKNQSFQVLNDNNEIVSTGNISDSSQAIDIIKNFSIKEVVLRGSKKLSKNFMLDINDECKELKYTFMKG